MRMARVLVIGLGQMGRSHALAQLAAGSQIVGLVNRSDVALPDALAGLPRFASLKDGLAARPDLVVIATYADSHAALAIQAMEAGAHVFVEKPIATTVADARRVAEIPCHGGDAGGGSLGICGTEIADDANAGGEAVGQHRGEEFLQRRAVSPGGIIAAGQLAQGEGAFRQGLEHEETGPVMTGEFRDHGNGGIRPVAGKSRTRADAHTVRPRLFLQRHASSLTPCLRRVAGGWGRIFIVSNNAYI
ncbi:MAG: hypothetical protein B7X99_10355 [Rhizobiales bacterium 17-65-6]|nr:MAG: hypothetical protein B7X99_10355 [Rhizobiales bacterium 17-65-6]